MKKRISKRVVDDIRPTGSEFTIWDTDIVGFGIRVRPSGMMTYVLVYRAGHGRKAPVKKLKIGEVSKLTPEQARNLARKYQGSVAHGQDPAAEKAENRKAMTVSELAEVFIADHAMAKRKSSTSSAYASILRLHVLPELGSTKAERLNRAIVSKLHGRMQDRKALANKTLAVIGSMYSFAQERGYVPDGHNPANRVEKYREVSRERFLTEDELGRLGEALSDAETIGLPWDDVDATKPTSKHLARTENRRRKFDPFAVAAVRLLLLTGCRKSEILTLQWSHLDTERGMLFLPDSKTGRKPVVLNAPALTLLSNLKKIGPYVIPGEDAGGHRHDLKRLWAAVTKNAQLDGVRIHDLRHTFASVGAGKGLGLPIVGKLLGHTQAATTARYAHVDNDPARRASQLIGETVDAALNRSRALL